MVASTGAQSSPVCQTHLVQVEEAQKHSTSQWAAHSDSISPFGSEAERLKGCNSPAPCIMTIADW
ncbi:hypothetical protein E2C01_013142 [Portunus trituberculatus]|uniref:Uncharacterized protein n=1 Tax=Portunus trituberculatus TaxID=210409 RepID=A0A5B7DGA9_PORTR|nr:hypothetical protein [Portunus trituberculatus]